MEVLYNLIQWYSYISIITIIGLFIYLIYIDIEDYNYHYFINGTWFNKPIYKLLEITLVLSILGGLLWIFMLYFFIEDMIDKYII